ncbi:acyltransferase family protein [Mariprofundus aestuarium]|nr:acyltransferase family protein [Mariprofundus aestuarium]
MHYRSDIDGLRAIAIIPVVLFHLGASAFSGGFVGVDIFFVISGFLITSIIFQEMEQGHFSFAQFYERRIRRLFPALFFVVIVVVIAGAFLFVPGDFRSLSQSIVAATAFSANLLFWDQSGYFDASAAMKPLLHTWSLSVEEQFYIGYPVILLLLIRFLPKHLSAVLILIMLVSFVSSITIVYYSQDSAFYLPIFRAWELLLGALIALNFIPSPQTNYQRHLLSLLGFSLILYAVFVLSEESLFPGVNAVYPCLGAALIIYAGNGGHPSIVGKLLGWRPFVMTGLISYSLYLWHWPLIVFTKYYLMRELIPVEQLTVLIISILLALFSWRYIERPFRGKSGLLTTPRLFKVSAALMVVFIAAGLAGHFTYGFSQRMPEEVEKLAETVHKPYPLRSLEDKKIQANGGKIFALGDFDHISPSYLVWGDSHAWALGPALDEVGKKEKKAGWLISHNGCPSLLGVNLFESGAIKNACADSNVAVVNFIENNPEIRTVFLVARWGVYANGTRLSGEKKPPVVLTADGVKYNEKIFQKGLEDTLSFLESRNIKTYFVSDVPAIGWDVPSILLRSKLFERNPPYTPPLLEEYQARQSPVNDALGMYRNMQFQTIDVSPLFCPTGQCLVESEGGLLYRDDNHLSIFGAHFASRLFEGLM